MAIFDTEASFEKAVVEKLINKGWSPDVIKYPTEEVLIANWADILFKNNRQKDRLNDKPLTDTEMQQLLNQIKGLNSPVARNLFINGGSVSLVRDNPDDPLHLGKNVYLDIYDKDEIAAGKSVYQIVEQPKFARLESVLKDRRGDIMLLINGIPVIHIELKKNKGDVDSACYQIRNYMKEGMFSGLFSLIQVFVAMEPSETKYFANPGSYDKFNEAFFFHWSDFNNNIINDWDDIISTLLYIPMAHQLIGYYTVPDIGDGILKVMRSYQVFAASLIMDRVIKLKDAKDKQPGGFIWHTTGSGKTLTSFKAAQLIANTGYVDKVVFVVDRIELGNQSFDEYKGFASPKEKINDTDDSGILFSKLTSDNTKKNEKLIITSIQKLSNINESNYNIEMVKDRRIVFIIDECHRSTFGDMMADIKEVFLNATFFGFTGTPIFEENAKAGMTMADIFGDEIHRYTLSEGIRDKNVLGFDPSIVKTYKDAEIIEKVALYRAKAKDSKEALGDEQKKSVYLETRKMPMAGYIDKTTGKYVKGIEDFIPNSQYDCDAHRRSVVENIVENFIDNNLSLDRKFHAIFATSSIKEAIAYYDLLKKTELNVTALFDPAVDNNPDGVLKSDALKEIINDYMDKYGGNYDIASYGLMKEDIVARLSHKEPYQDIDSDDNAKIDVLIVVDQLLTGFDSMWVNTLYLDKVLQNQNLIQAFSRTNRIFNESEKPFGIIKYYRMPNTMKDFHIPAAVKLYSGDKEFALFSPKLDKHIEKINELFKEISEVFISAGIDNFEKIPQTMGEQAMFAKLFVELHQTIMCARLQGYKWGQPVNAENGNMLTCSISEDSFNTLIQRYRELPTAGRGPHADDPPFTLKPYITDTPTDRITDSYINSKYEKWVRDVSNSFATEEEKERALNELHKSFASLSQDEQKYADMFVHDMISGQIKPEIGKTIRDYINQYLMKGRERRIERIVEAIGVDKTKLTNFMDRHPTEKNFEYARFEEVVDSCVEEKVASFFSNTDPLERYVEQFNLLKDFVINDGIDID